MNKDRQRNTNTVR